MRRSGYSWAAPIAWALVLGCFIVIVGSLPTTRDMPGRRAAAAITIKVASADTLWSIAEAHPVPGATTAQRVDAIMEANRLGSATLHQGDTLTIPVAGDSGTAFAQVSDAPAAD